MQGWDYSRLSHRFHPIPFSFTLYSVPEHRLVEVEEHEEREKAGLVEAEKANLKRRRVGYIHEPDLRALAELSRLIDARHLSAALEFIRTVVAISDLRTAVDLVRKVCTQ